MLKLATAAAVLAFASLPMTAFAAAPTDGAFQVANIAPPEEPEAPPVAPPAPETPAADPAAPTVNDAPPAEPEAPAPENPIAPTDTPEAVEAAPPEPAPAAAETTEPAVITETPETAGGSNMGTIIGVIAFLAVAAGAGYWFMNRKA
jgi:hypothetical protein